MKTGSGIEPDQVRNAYLAACRLDVTALKPGNVSEAVAGHGMTADDFHRSSHASADAISNPGLSLGARIYSAVAATRSAVGCNTNLGMLLLCAPLAEAAMQARPGEDLHRALQVVLRDATVDDAEQVFAAIRLANPGGLGDADAHDVRDIADVPLRQAMAAAADRDRIARQYASGFADLFEDALPRYTAVRLAEGDEHRVVTDLYLYLLSSFPDSHVLRKHGYAAAIAVRDDGIAVYADWRADRDSGAGEQLQAFDQRLKGAGINPGTTADLTVATLFLERLLHAAALNPGQSCRATLRQLRLASSGAPLISMLLIGES